MANRYNPTELAELTAWAQQAAETLSLKPLDQHEIDVVLDSAAQVSAELMRAAGPLAMYLAGLLVATGQAADVATACRMVGRLMNITDVSISLDEVEHTAQGFSD